MPENRDKWLIGILAVLVLYLLMRQAKVSNKEQWQLHRDESGKIDSVTVWRDVKAS